LFLQNLANVPLSLPLARVNSANVLDEELKDRGKRALDELKGKDPDKQGET
jgi:hypothetical protein